MENSSAVIAQIETGGTVSEVFSFVLVISALLNSDDHSEETIQPFHGVFSDEEYKASNKGLLLRLMDRSKNDSVGLTVLNGAIILYHFDKGIKSAIFRK